MFQVLFLSFLIHQAYSGILFFLRGCILFIFLFKISKMEGQIAGGLVDKKEEAVIFAEQENVVLLVALMVMFFYFVYFLHKPRENFFILVNLDTYISPRIWISPKWKNRG